MKSDGALLLRRTGNSGSQREWRDSRAGFYHKWGFAEIDCIHGFVCRNGVWRPPEILPLVRGRAAAKSGGRGSLTYIYPGYLRMNRTLMVTREGVGCPFNIAGRYFHFFTALSASSISNGCPSTTRIFSTTPLTLTVPSKTTTPSTLAFLARGG